MKKFKKGQAVKAISARGHVSRGKVVGTRDTGGKKGGGVWIDINVGERGKPEIKSYRPASVTPV